MTTGTASATTIERSAAEARATTTQSLERSDSPWQHAYADTWVGSAESPRVTVSSRQQIRAAIAVAAVFVFVTVGLLPFASLTGPSLPGFVPAYQTAVFLFYALSSLHLFNHFRRTRLIALLHIAAGSLFAASILLVQLFSFPIWGPTQLVGATSATTSWLWFFWHLGPAVLTLSYLLALGNAASLAVMRPTQSAAPVIARAILVALGLTAVATALSTLALPLLPTISHGDDFRALITSGVGTGVLLLTVAVLMLLIWRTRCASTIELCLALALALLALDNVLTLAGGSRLSIGWYAGRAEAAISAAVLLGFYVMDIDRRYARVTEQAQMLSEDRAVLNEIVTEQRDANAALLMLAREDALTGLANRRRFDEQLRQEWLRAYREKQTLTLLMLDVDHFKKYNDHYGHQTGDVCLRTIAGLMQEVGRRPADMSARYGGEEFVMLLPNSDELSGMRAANALLSLLEWQHVEHATAPMGRVTLSIGVATCNPSSNDLNPDELVAAADRALYAAKRGGRNQARAAVNPGA